MGKKKLRSTKKKKNEEQVISLETAKVRRLEKREMKARKNALKADRKKQKKKQSFFGRYKKLYLLILIVIAGVICAWGARVISLNMNLARVEEERNAALMEKARLERELNMINDPAYIEQQARTRLRMIRPGEILYVLPESGDTDAAVPEETTDPPRKEVEEPASSLVETTQTETEDGQA